jgi:serine acetyltransferase
MSRAVGHIVALGARTRIGDHAVVHSADVPHEVGVAGVRLAALKARSTGAPCRAACECALEGGRSVQTRDRTLRTRGRAA